MSARADLPPALVAVLDAGMALVRRAPSARIAIVRAGELFEPEALRPAVREALEREAARAAASVMVPLPFGDVERALREAWGDRPSKVLDDLDPEPISVRPGAQVHRGERDGEPVAVKVRRPGIERSVRNDLALLEALIPPLRAAFPALDAGAVLREVREQALDELDLEHEASTLRRLARPLRDVPGVAVPRPHLDLAAGDVLVTSLLPGETLAAGARPDDPNAAAHALIAAFRVAVLDAGVAPCDLRATHVLVAPDGTLGLLGLGVARPVDKARAQLGLDGLAALGAGDEAAFGRVHAALGVLPADRAADAFALLRALGGDLLGGPARLDAAALRGTADRVAAATRDIARLAPAASPQPSDLPLARMLGQLVAVLARLGATEDWVDAAVRPPGAPR